MNESQNWKYITVIELARLLRMLDGSSSPSLLVVDVRDHDYMEGRVRGSYHAPHSQLNVNRLVEVAQSKRQVIFHCHYSITRGPDAAQRYSKQAPSKQEILVLKGGFKAWRDNFGDQPDLYEPFTS